jgi:hypothetical protein
VATTEAAPWLRSAPLDFPGRAQCVGDPLG